MLAFTKNVALFLSLASAVAVSAVETEGNLRAGSVGDTERNLLNWGSWGSYNCVEYRADFHQDPNAQDNDQGVDGTVRVKQCGDDTETTATWKVNIQDFNDDTCVGTDGSYTGTLNWHIHALPTDGTSCQSGTTSGHYDPTYACGPATQWSSSLCSTINDSRGGSGYSYSAECGNDTQEGCELGDLSGKMGKVDTTLSSWKVQRFDDEWLGGIGNIAGLSIVFHCCDDSGCGRRVGCANLYAA